VRTSPNFTNSDNFSTKGNINPHTGEPGWVNSDKGKANNISTYNNYNYEIDTAKLNYEKKYGARDYLMQKKIEDAFYDEIIRKYSNSKQNINYSNENDEYFVEENITENNIEENSFSDSDVERGNSDLSLKENNTSSQNDFNNNYDKDKSVIEIEKNKQSKHNSDKYIFPIVIILSIIILFFKSK
jgi:hypothetical protein